MPLSGFINSDFSFTAYQRGYYSYFWTATELTSIESYYRGFTYNLNTVDRH
ncbi:hypothetical protein ACFLY2_02105 [Patescibacteria group bacterium]